jgi:hypothetical protein
MRSGPRARGASCPDLIISNRHLKLDLGPTIHAASCQQKTPERFSVSPEGFPATNQIGLGGLLPFPAPAEQT